MIKNSMKNEMTLLDLFAICSELKKLEGIYLNNIYDIDSHNFLFKFNNEYKDTVLVSMGKYIFIPNCPPTDRKPMPSSFCTKLRKQIKNKRLISIGVFHFDRVLKLQFGEEDYTNYLIIDFISKGNIILTDKDLKILSHVRSHTYDSEHKIKVNETYPEEILQKELLLPEPMDYHKLKCLIGPDITKEIKYNYSHEEPLKLLERILMVFKETSGAIGYCSRCNNEVTPYDFYYVSDDYCKYKSFNCALNSYIKVNGIETKKVTKKPKLTKEELIQKCNQGKIDKLTKKVNKLTEELKIMSENQHEIEKGLLNPGSIRGKEHLVTVLGIDLYADLNFHKNLNKKYDMIWQYNSQIEKTKEGLKTALQNVQKKTKRVKTNYISLITDKWYHEYHWFYTSNDFLVICGKSSTHNEIIVKKYLEKNDIYFHSEVAGSGSTVIKNPDNREITPIDLEETADFVICHSKAWGGAPDSAYWVNSDQVSKTTETGEFVQKGSFIVRGKRNFISNTRMELGAAIYKKQFMVGPYRRIMKLDNPKIKIVYGKNKRNKSLQEINRKFKIDKKYHQIVDKVIRNNLKIYI